MISTFYINERTSARDAVEWLTTFVTSSDTVLVYGSEAKADLIKCGLGRLYGEYSPTVEYTTKTFDEIKEGWRVARNEEAHSSIKGA